MRSGLEAQGQRAPGPWLGWLLLPNLSQVNLTPTRALRPLPQVLGVGDSGSAHGQAELFGARGVSTIRPRVTVASKFSFNFPVSSGSALSPHFNHKETLAQRGWWVFLRKPWPWRGFGEDRRKC